MADENTHIQFYRGSKKALAESNPILLNGQPVYEYDTGKLKIGNGKDHYNDLSYIGYNSNSNAQYTLELYGNKVILNGTNGSNSFVDITKIIKSYLDSNLGYLVDRYCVAKQSIIKYNLTKDPKTNLVSLVGTDGSKSTVLMENTDTKYSLNLKDNDTIILSSSMGISSSINLSTLKRNSYTLEKYGNEIILTDGNGKRQSIYVNETDTTYSIKKEDEYVVLYGSDNSISKIKLDNTTYSIQSEKLDGGEGILQKLIGSDGSIYDIGYVPGDCSAGYTANGKYIPLLSISNDVKKIYSYTDINNVFTSYKLSTNEDTLTLIGSDGSTSSVVIPNTSDTLYEIGVDNTTAYNTDSEHFACIYLQDNNGTVSYANINDIVKTVNKVNYGIDSVSKPILKDDEVILMGAYKNDSGDVVWSPVSVSIENNKLVVKRVNDK